MLQKREELSEDFDPTYKGLKLRREDFLPTLCSISILPIRDWNRRSLNTSLILLTISILPIRDWNLLPNFFYDDPFTISILPIRDWNLSGGANNTACDVISILPIRDWNTKISSGGRSKNARNFDPTYKGLKRVCYYFYAED